MKSMEPLSGSTGTDIFGLIAGPRMPTAWTGLLSWIILLGEPSVVQLRRTAPTFSLLTKETVVRSSILAVSTRLFHSPNSRPVIFPEYWILPLPGIPILERSLERTPWAGMLSTASSTIPQPRDSSLTAPGFVILSQGTSYPRANSVPLLRRSWKLRILPILLSRHSEGISLV